jgi:hypothetical protein
MTHYSKYTKGNGNDRVVNLRNEGNRGIHISVAGDRGMSSLNSLVGRWQQHAPISNTNKYNYLGPNYGNKNTLQ